MSDVLVARGLCKRFGGVVAAQDVDVRIGRNDIVSLLGTNGAGKTTFVNMVTGYIRADKGNIIFDGRSIVGLAPRQIARLGISRSFQIPQIFSDLTVLENVLVALDTPRTGTALLGRAKTARKEEEVYRLLADYRLDRFAEYRGSEIPGGARKLLDVALAVASKPTVLLLDEPTSGVSASEKFAIMDLMMAALRQTDVSILFIEHDMEIVRRYAHKAIAFHEGRVLADGTVDEVLCDRAVQSHVVGKTMTETKPC